MQKFTKEVATREASRARILLDGAAGSGKTFTALLFAKTLGKSTLLFDSENKSSTKYSDRFQFNVVKITDFSPKNYTDAIKYGQAETEEVLVVDSISHAWAGEGGALELAETSKVKTGGNKWAAWSLVTPDLNSLTNAILQCEKHLICTARVKTDWELSEEGGKKKYNKVGLATVARQEFDYEFDLHFRMIAEGTEHFLHVLKSRYNEIKVGELIKNPDEAFAERLAKVISTGISPEDAEKIKALAYYEKLAAQAVELGIKFNHHTEASDIDAIKADGKKLREEIAAKEAPAKAAKPADTAKPESTKPGKSQSGSAMPAQAKPEPVESENESQPPEYPDIPDENEAPSSSAVHADMPQYQQAMAAIDKLDLSIARTDAKADTSAKQSLFDQQPPLRGAPVQDAPSPTTAEFKMALSRARSIEDLASIASQMGKMVVFGARLKQILKAEGVTDHNQLKPGRLSTVVTVLTGFLVDAVTMKGKR